MIDPNQPDYANPPESAARPRFEYGGCPADVAPAVSIVTVLEGDERLLPAVATALRRQSRRDWEWFVVASTASVEAAAALALADDDEGRIRVLEMATGEAPGAAWNRAAGMARARLLLLLPPTARLEPTALEKWTWFLECYPGCAAVDAWLVCDGEKSYLHAAGRESWRKVGEPPAACGTLLVRQAAFEAVGGVEGGLARPVAEWDLSCRLAAGGYPCATVPEYLAWERPERDPRVSDGEALRDPAFRAYADSLAGRFPELVAGGVPPWSRCAHDSTGPVAMELPQFPRLAKSRPRLLLIMPWMAVGGVEKFNLDVVGQLVGRGWEVTAVTTTPGDNALLPEFARHSPDIFIAMHCATPAAKPLLIRHFIESRQPDAVLVTHTEPGYLLLPYLRATCPGPVYLDFNHIEDPAWKGGGYPAYGVRFQDQLDLSLVASEHLKQWMVDHGADGGRIEVVHVNVDPEQWRPDAELRRKARAARGWADDVPVIGFAGRLCGQKQPLIFARVMAALAARGVGFRAVVAGDGELRRPLETYLKEHELGDRVLLLGTQTIREMQAILASVDLFFLPSEWEGIALSIYEAMSCGLAVVGADVGGQRELVTPDCGLLLSRGTPEEEVAGYTEALAALLADPERRRQMGEQGRRRIIEKFSLDVMGAKLVAAVERARAIRGDGAASAVSGAAATACAMAVAEVLRYSHAAHDLWRSQQQHASDDQVLRQWVGRLEEAKTWLEGQRADWERSAGELRNRLEELQRRCAGWQQQPLVRILRWMGVIRGLPPE